MSVINEYCYNLMPTIPLNGSLINSPNVQWRLRGSGVGRRGEAAGPDGEREADPGWGWHLDCAHVSVHQVALTSATVSKLKRPNNTKL